MTLPQLIIPILMAAATPMVDSAATASPAATSPAVVAPVPAATPQPVKLEFPQAGYRINALDLASNERFFFTMSLPVPGLANGQSPPSVSVNRELTMKERPSYQNFKDAKTLREHNGDTILLERTISPTEWQTEYISTKAEHLNFETGMKIHIYRRMVTANGMTYDVSATAPEIQWPELGAKLKACVDSFEPSTDPAPGKVVFSQQGYRINKLDGAAPARTNERLLNMSGNSVVTVGIEPYPKTLKDYQAEHKPRVTISPHDKVKIIAESSPAEDTLVTEYALEGSWDRAVNINNPRVIIRPPPISAFVYEKVVLAHSQLYWATGIHLDADKTVSSAQIKACVESLEAIPILAPAPAPASTATAVPASAPLPVSAPASAK